MKRMIIGFSGKRGVGKTQAAMYMSRRYGFKTLSFAGSLKEMAKVFFPFTPNDFLEKNKETPYGDYDWTPRDFLISLGKFARFYDEDFWVRKSGVDEAKESTSVDDVRFPNEVKYLKDLGARIIRIERFESMNIYGKNLDDPSETSLDDYKDFDGRIDACRNTTLKELYSSLDSIVKDLGIK
jgi:hypothetical protein